MKNHIFFILAAILVSTFAVVAQEEPDTNASEKPKVYIANPNDVKSIDSIIKAVYDVISGDVGVERNWDRFHSLFHPRAHLIPTGQPRGAEEFAAFPITPAEYIKRSGTFLVTNGFHEQEIARKTEVFGHIAHVFSTYEGRNKLTDEKPFLRGINSFQLFNDGKRWWVLSIYWQQESKDDPIPEKYLKTRD